MKGLARLLALLFGTVYATFVHAIVPWIDPVDIAISIEGPRLLNTKIETALESTCVAGTLSRFDNGTTQYVSWFCVMSPATVPGLTAPRNVLIHKSDNLDCDLGGVMLTADAQSANQLVLTAGSCSTPVAGGWTGCTQTGSYVIDASVSYLHAASHPGEHCLGPTGYLSYYQIAQLEANLCMYWRKYYSGNVPPPNPLQLLILKAIAIHAPSTCGLPSGVTICPDDHDGDGHASPTNKIFVTGACPYPATPVDCDDDEARVPDAAGLCIDSDNDGVWAVADCDDNNPSLLKPTDHPNGVCVSGSPQTRSDPTGNFSITFPNVTGGVDNINIAPVSCSSLTSPASGGYQLNMPTGCFQVNCPTFTGMATIRFKYREEQLAYFGGSLAAYNNAITGCPAKIINDDQSFLMQIQKYSNTGTFVSSAGHHSNDGWDHDNDGVHSHDFACDANCVPCEGLVERQVSSCSVFALASLDTGGDSDDDAIPTIYDNCPLVANSDQTDTDGDGVGDSCDSFPEDNTESKDEDGDGVGDNTDNCPVVSNTTQLDTDTDGVGDACDAFPINSNESLDSDGDGMGDHFESQYNLNPFDPSDASLDPDNDGYSNLEEYQNGTNPQVVITSTPKVEDIPLPLWSLLVLASLLTGIRYGTGIRRVRP